MTPNRKEEFANSISEFEVVRRKAIEAFTTLKADWLRSEIEKLEGMQSQANEQYFMTKTPETWGELEVLETIITRYREELKVLESK